MTTDELDRRILAAYNALKGARAAATRSPNRETIRLENLAETVVNQLLERRHQTTSNLVRN